MMIEVRVLVVDVLGGNIRDSRNCMVAAALNRALRKIGKSLIGAVKTDEFIVGLTSEIDAATYSHLTWNTHVEKHGAWRIPAKIRHLIRLFDDRSGRMPSLIGLACSKVGPLKVDDLLIAFAFDLSVPQAAATVTEIGCAYQYVPADVLLEPEAPSVKAVQWYSPSDPMYDFGADKPAVCGSVLSSSCNIVWPAEYAPEVSDDHKEQTVLPGFSAENGQVPVAKWLEKQGGPLTTAPIGDTKCTVSEKTISPPDRSAAPAVAVS